MFAVSIRNIIAASLLLASASVLAQNGTENVTENGARKCPNNLPGFTLQGDNCKVLCHPARWTDILLFFLGNYVAHAATALRRPGQSTLSTGVAFLMALLLPGGGVRHGIETIMSFAILQPTPLRTAARAGAICAVVKTRLRRPVAGETADEAAAMEEELRLRLRPANPPWSFLSFLFAPTVYIRGVGHMPYPVTFDKAPSRQTILSTPKIHGVCRLPEGYELMVVHGNATFQDDEDEDTAEAGLLFNKPWWHPKGTWKKATRIFQPKRTMTISCNYNFTKSLISIVQLLFGITTLYRAKADQLDRFGYAAFGLTVAPYVWMSMINLLGNVLCPQYDCIYIAESEGLRQFYAWRAGASAVDQERYKVEGVIGRLDEGSDERLKEYHRERLCLRTLLRHEHSIDVTGWEDVVQLQSYTILRVFRILSQLAPLDITDRFWWLPNTDRFGWLPELETTYLKIQIEGLVRSAVWSFVAAAVPLVIVGTVSSFRPGQSTVEERGWMMAWLVCGVLGQLWSTPAVFIEGRPSITTGDRQRYHSRAIYMCVVLAFGVPSIGGMVTVGRMIRDFGVCQWLG
ncbi:hypothetical protein MAPG_12021 [Magnaporthiopsis poae ATCC 64411]|uniref:Uncharacterized protein n=1 Tax=Magnaporthiopsis poae (strain ATCC 64411 / 73-15) TaxID=644358 RepID=A0A0C4EGP1_MAGP6|nr:hypothetical protein MAPG_12021 [Magnaporthiopsis poae ATCC 64411]